jgi:hypothetical protein
MPRRGQQRTDTAIAGSLRRGPEPIPGMEAKMRRGHGTWKQLIAPVIAAAFVGCGAADDALGPGELAFHHNPGHGGGGGGKGGDGGGDGGDAMTATLADGMDATFENVNYNESNRMVRIGGGRGAVTQFRFAATSAMFAGNPESCEALRDNGRPVDDPTRDLLASYMMATLSDTGLEFEFDSRGGQSRNHKVIVHTFDDGVTVHVGITGHNDPQPVITRAGDTYTVTGGVVRVWMRDGSSRDHPKLFCPNAGDVVTVTVDGT